MIDLIFVITYGVLFAGLVAALFRSRGGRITLWVLVAATVALDLAEDLCIVVLMITRSASALVDLLWWCTTLKWLFLACVAATLLLRFVVPQRATVAERTAAAPNHPSGDEIGGPKAVVLRTLRALMHHRFSVAMIIPLVVLTMLSGSAILEQLPDVQRRWASDGVRGAVQAGCAVIALIAVAVLLEIFSRFRTGWAERHQVEPATEQPQPVPGPDTDATTTGASGTDVPPTDAPNTDRAPHRPAHEAGTDEPGRQHEPWLKPLVIRLALDLRLIGVMIIEGFTRPRRVLARMRHVADEQEALLGLWLLGALIPGIAALVAGFVMEAPVLGRRLLIFCAVPLTVVVISWILRRAWQVRKDWYVPDRPPRFTALEVSTIRFTGRALALTAGTVGGIGLVRSFLSVVALGPDITGSGWGASVFFLALGVAGVVLPWAVSWALARRAVRDPLAAIGRKEAVSLWGRWALLVGVLVLFVAIAVFPGQVAHLGVSAVAIASLTLLIGIPASAGLLIQERPTAEIFRILGLRRTPLVSVLLLAVVLAGLSAGTNRIHPVASTPSAQPVTRPPVGRMVQTWLQQPGACEVEVNGQRVRPMIMIAAEGGGIRAAYWTVQGSSRSGRRDRRLRGPLDAVLRWRQRRLGRTDGRPLLGHAGRTRHRTRRRGRQGDGGAGDARAGGDRDLRP